MGDVAFSSNWSTCRQRYSFTKAGLTKKVRSIAVREKRADDVKVHIDSTEGFQRASSRLTLDFLDPLAHLRRNYSVDGATPKVDG